jgi:hypothetical protein
MLFKNILVIHTFFFSFSFLYFHIYVACGSKKYFLCFYCFSNVEQ